MAQFGGGPKTGFLMKLYINTGSHETPSWLEIADVQDVSVDDLTLSTAELKRRGSPFTKKLASIFNATSVSFTYIHGCNKAMFARLKNQFWNKTIAELFIADGVFDDEETQGLIIPCLLTEFPWDQPLEDVSTHECKAELAYKQDASEEEIDPVWMVVAGST